ncbi:hypothetical protein [Acinetobacter johnsonii]|uniref:hypothetical protein n=1 Tax=Acinetobacter johnsonii TaxID=40214 RepID=UPI001F3E3326|nr:hypothetical protein [Acinetobacter johnsonii]
MEIKKLKAEFEKLKYIEEKLEYLNFDEHLGCYVEKNNGMPVGLAAWVNGAFYGFEQAAKAQAVPEGFVLVPKENISCYWQDNDEPENFCSNESDFDCLGDCIDLGEIMEINKFTQAHVNKEILFGTWFAEAIDPSEKANFFVGTHAECLEIVAKNKAMIEAQEQSHECQNP